MDTEKKPSDHEERVAGDLESAAVQAIAAGGAALAAGPAWAAGLTAGATFFASMWPALRQRLQRRSKHLAAAYAPGQSEEQAARMLADASQQESNAEVIAETYRRVQEAIDDAVVPALGRLLREYTDAQRPSDRFLKSVSRLLAELERDEFENLRELMTYLVGVVQELGDTVDVLTVLEHDRGADRIVVKGYDDTSGGLTGVKHAHRLLSLLAAYGVGREAILWGDGAGLDISPALIGRLDALLNGG